MAKDVILFEPVPGYTYQFAIKTAIKLAQTNNKLVKLTVNNVVMNVTKEADFVKLVRLYESLTKQK